MKRKKYRVDRALDDGMYIAGLAALVVLVPLGVWYARHLNEGWLPVCMAYRLFGVYCPGCGGSRALAALLKGRIGLSFLYHPLVLYTACIYTGFMGSQTISRLLKGRVRAMHFHHWFLYAALGIVLVNCIVKNVLKFCFHIMFF